MPVLEKYPEIPQILTIAEAQLSVGFYLAARWRCEVVCYDFDKQSLKSADIHSVSERHLAAKQNPRET